MMKTKLTLFVTVLAAALFGVGCASTQGVILDKTVTPVTNRILFSSPRDGTHSIYTMNGDGSDQRNILYSPQFHDWGGSWSPDGRHIAFVRGMTSSYNTLFIMNADGTGVQQLAKVGTNSDRFEWSPDGKHIVHHKWTNPVTGLIGGVVGALANAKYGAGSSLASKTFPTPNYEILVIGVEDGVTRNLTKSPHTETYPHWSPDGTQIVFHCLKNPGSVNDNLRTDWDIYAINIDGSGRRRLTSHPKRDWIPTWSPDGKKIAFWSDRTGNWELFLMNPDGSDQQQISKEKEAGRVLNGISPAVWSPDSKSLLINSVQEPENQEIYRIDIAAGKTTRLTRTAGNDYATGWSRFP